MSSWTPLPLVAQTYFTISCFPINVPPVCVLHSVHVKADVSINCAAAAKDEWRVVRTVSVTVRSVATWTRVPAWWEIMELLYCTSGISTCANFIKLSCWSSQDVAEINDTSKESVSVPEDPTAVSPQDATFFRPPCVPPTKKAGLLFI